jgi:hypothetical protein
LTVFSGKDLRRFYQNTTRRVKAMTKSFCREEFTKKMKSIIGLRVGYRCSLPDCNVLTVGPKEGEENYSNSGKACHIAAASPGGPRYDASMSSKQRRSADNGIWLCGTHATQIDIEKEIFPTDLLIKLKGDAESRTSRMFGKAVQIVLEDTQELYVTEVSYTDTKYVVLNNGGRIAYASIFSLDDKDLTYFASSSFRVFFLIEKTRDDCKITLNSLCATVYDWKPLPTDFKHASYATPVKVYPYFLTLDLPETNRPRQCFATHYCPDGVDKPQQFVPIMLDSFSPEIIEVRYNARESGIYTFSLDAKFVSKGFHKTYRLHNKICVMFEKFNQNNKASI